jgi:hypothetical protein
MASHVTKCLSLVKGRRLRVTKLDGCGRPIYGDDSQVVSKGFISVAFTANTTDSDEINVTNAAGEVCVYEAAVTSLVGYGIEIQFCNVDPELFSLVTGQPVVTAADGSTVIGFDVDTKITLDNSNFALELWAGSPAGDACSTAGAQGSYGYLLLPYLTGGILGDFTVENGSITFTLTGANTKEGNSWGVGPYPVMLGNGGTDEAQTVTITGTPTGGSFTLTFNGQTTGTIAYNAAATAVQTALIALSNIDTGDVTVTGGPGPGTPYVVTFGGQYADENVPQMTATPSFTGGTSPNVTVTTTTAGVAPTPGAMTSPVSTSVALRTMIVDVAPPEDACGARPVLDPTTAPLTAISGTPTARVVAFTTTPSPSAGPVWWDFGDDTWDYVAAPGSTSHTYAAAGTYTVMASNNGIKWVSTSVTVS